MQLERLQVCVLPCLAALATALLVHAQLLSRQELRLGRLEEWLDRACAGNRAICVSVDRTF